MSAYSSMCRWRAHGPSVSRNGTWFRTLPAGVNSRDKLDSEPNQEDRGLPSWLSRAI
jgi:hypothetical protein